MINTSIVIYNHSVSEINRLIENLKQSKLVKNIYLIDNSPTPLAQFQELYVNYIFTGKNLGYGAAHNIALRKTIEQSIPYHLVINPDISFNTTIFESLVHTMNNNSEIGQIMPKVYYPNGEIQYLCKLLPTPLDLIFRAFFTCKLD